MDEKRLIDPYELKKATTDIIYLRQDLENVKREVKETKTDDKDLTNRIAKMEKEQALQGQKLDTLIQKQAEQSKMIKQAIYGAIATAIIGAIVALIRGQIGV